MSRSELSTSRTALPSRRVAFRNFSYSLRGNANNAIVTLPDLSISENSAFSVCFFFNTPFNKTTTFFVAVSEGDLAVGLQNWEIYVYDSFGSTGSKRIRWRIQDITNPVLNLSTSTANNVACGWNHVACVQESATSRKIYLNGVLNFTSTTSTSQITNVSSTQLFCVKNSGSNTQFARADLNDVQFYNVALDSTQIANLYFDNIVPTSGLVARYLCTEGSGTTLTDSVSGQNGTISNATWVTESGYKARTAIASARSLAA